MLPSIENYNMYHKLRKYKCGGGVSLPVNKKYNSYDINIDFAPETFEFICRNVTINNEGITYISIYRPSDTNKVLYMKERSDFFSIMNLKYNCCG